MKAVLLLLLVASTYALDLNPKNMPNPKFKKMNLRGLGKSLTNLQWTDCDGTGTPYVVVNTINIQSTWNIGQNVTVTATGNVKQVFTVASIDLIVIVSGIKIFSGNQPLTEPVTFQAGAENINFSEPLPLSPPSGSFKVTAKLRNNAGTELQCFYVTFNLQ